MTRSYSPSIIRVPPLPVPLVLLVALLLPAVSFAASTGMPWEGPLSTITASLQGPILRAASFLGIVGTAVGFLVAGPGHGLVKGFLTVGLVICIAAAAAPVFLPMLGISGGLLI